MKALHFADKLELVDSPIPQPGDGEALVRMRMAGICRTDLEIVQGYMGFNGILGHEFVGEVVECASDKKMEGQRVCGEINLAPWTRDSVQQRHDPNRLVLGILGKDGCFAEYLTLPRKNLFEIPDSITDSQATFVEPIAAACEILEQIHIKPTDTIAVLGDGRLGQLCAQVLRLISNNLLLIGKHQPKLELADQLDIQTMNLSDLDGDYDQGFDIVVDCTGKPEGLPFSLKLTKPRGCLVLKTTTAIPPDFNTADIVINEITVVGSRCGQFPPAIDLLARQLVVVDPLIENVFALSHALEAMEVANQPGVLKVLLKNDL